MSREGERPLVSVVVPNWNGARWLRNCLGSLRGQSYDPKQIIVVDGASRDESVEIVRDEFSEVDLVCLPENRGFSGNVNAGIRRADGEIIVLLNNDAEAEPDWLAELVRPLIDGVPSPESRVPSQDDPGSHSGLGTWNAELNIGMCASKILLFDPPNVINSAGDFFGPDGMPGNRGVWEQDVGQYDQEELVFGACAGAAAYRRAMLDDVGLFDEGFFAYCEDVDMNFRAQLKGYSCLYVPTARVGHHLSATGGGPFASYYCGRNFLRVVARNLPTPLLVKWGGRILGAQLKLALESIRHFREPAARARLRGQLSGLLSIPGLSKGRSGIQKNRRVSDEYLVELIAGSHRREGLTRDEPLAARQSK